jgi:molybdenum cofactor cytidylyltransferase
MSTSLRAGVAAVLEMESAADAQLEGVAICLGDMPSVDAGILHPLAEALRSARKPMVAPSYRGTRGNPVLFAAALLPALLALEGDRGARDLLAARPQELALVPLDREVPRDVDTPEDLAALQRER